MTRPQLGFLFLNLGHFYDHFFLLIFATVAALALTGEWGLGYDALIPYATPGFIAFGLGAIPAGWIADRWSREGMMAIFFLGIGASAVATAFAQSPWQIAVGLFAVGIFAAIYHPVGLAMVVEGRARTGLPLAVNGVFGNLGVAGAALITGFLIDLTGWRTAFWLPGLVAVATGLGYLVYLRADREQRQTAKAARKGGAKIDLTRASLLRIMAIILISTAIGGLIYQSTTFALPKVFAERLGDLAVSASAVGGYAALVFTLAAMAQLVVGYLIDRVSLRAVFAVVAACQALFFLLLQQASGGSALVISVALMLAVFGQIPINDVLVGRIASSEWRSRIFALRYLVTFSVMASAVPLIAWIHGTWSFATLFLVLAGAAGAILAAVLCLPRVSQVMRPAPAA